MAPKLNKMQKIVSSINKTTLPLSLKQLALTAAFNSQVKYAGTTGIKIQEWTPETTVVTLKNAFRVRNHIGGIHACAMATLAESTTGMLFGMHVPDTHLPLMKSMKISYTKRAQGNLEAKATITDEQALQIQTQDKGDMVVDVKVTDDAGNSPIQCEMIWAWTPKARKAGAEK